MSIYPMTPIPDGTTTRSLDTYDVMVYTEGGHYYARDSRRNLICIDSTTACIQEAVNYLQNGGKIHIKSGVYNVYNTININVNNISIYGDGFATVINDYVNNGHLFNISGWYFDISEIKVQIATNKTTGNEFNVSGQYGRFSNIYIEMAGLGFNGFYFNSTWSIYLSDIRIYNIPVNNNGIVISNSSDIYISRLTIYNFGNNAGNGTGIVVLSTQGLWLTDIDIVSLATGISIAPPSGSIAEWIFMKSIAMDSCSGTGLYIGGSGSVYGIVGIDVWSSSNNTGIDIENGNGILIAGARTLNNKTYGIVVNSQYVSIVDALVVGNSRASKGTYEGIKVTASYVTIMNSIVADGIMGFAAQQSLGINIPTTADYVNIISNIITGNVNGQIGGLNNLGPNSKVKYNAGAPTTSSGQATIPSGSTSVTVNHGLICTPTLVNVTPLAQPSGSIWVSGITSTQFVINISTAPSANLPIAWYAEC
jgi:hypothetical protein